MAVIVIFVTVPIFAVAILWFTAWAEGRMLEDGLAHHVAGSDDLRRPSR